MNKPLDADVLELEDSWESINEWFLANDLTDGLPIVPPTEARVRTMTQWVERELGWKAQDAIATLAPKQGVATVEKIAANAVMAGCRADYLPVLIACVRAIGDPRFNLDASLTSTHNTSPLPIVNGPVRTAIDLNSGYNYTGSRWQATSAIGRALQLVMINIAGTPGSINIHTQGHIARFSHCIAENEEENPWEPLHIERGFEPGESTVTVIPACPAAMIDDNGGSQTAKDLLRTLADRLCRQPQYQRRGPAAADPLPAACTLARPRRLQQGGGEALPLGARTRTIRQHTDRQPRELQSKEP
jgi:hypothetical protein